LFSGKGVWDGLGGMLKQWLRTRIVSAMSYAPNSDDPDPFEAVASVRASDRVDTASDCFLIFRAYFELGEHGKAWRAKKVAKGAAITSMFFHWVPSSDIAPSRAAIPVHESVVGISTCYQFFVDRLSGPRPDPAALVLVRCVLDGRHGGAEGGHLPLYSPRVDFVNSTELRHVVSDSGVAQQRTWRSEGDKWVLFGFWLLALVSTTRRPNPSMPSFHGSRSFGVRRMAKV